MFLDMFDVFSIDIQRSVLYFYVSDRPRPVIVMVDNVTENIVINTLLSSYYAMFKYGKKCQDQL